MPTIELTSDTLVIELADTRYARVAIGTPDARALAARIDAAIAKRD